MVVPRPIGHRALEFSSATAVALRTGLFCNDAGGDARRFRVSIDLRARPRAVGW